MLVSCQNTTQSETKDSAHLQLSTHEIVVEYGDEVNLRDYVISGEWDELLLPDFKADSLGEYELNIIAKKNGEEISKTLRIRVIETILQNENSSTINSGISGDEGENTSVSTPPQSGAPSSRPGGEGTNPSVSTPPQTEAHNNSPIGEGENTSVSTPPQSDAPSSRPGGEGTNPSVSTPPQTEAHNNSPIGEGENTSVSTPPQSDAPSSEIAGESNTDTVDREEKLEFYMNAW
ncbi:hypothetical protein [Anaerorhabdus sp.]|uniref:hypothetical protein n=1 Tax=Anaerorhabdus sp. TaxID=1872524 RepID=UPI002FCC9B7F